MMSVESKDFGENLFSDLSTDPSKFQLISLNGPINGDSVELCLPTAIVLREAEFLALRSSTAEPG